jgi:hypothetical protein
MWGCCCPPAVSVNQQDHVPEGLQAAASLQMRVKPYCGAQQPGCSQTLWSGKNMKTDVMQSSMLTVSGFA